MELLWSVWVKPVRELPELAARVVNFEPPLAGRECGFLTFKALIDPQ